MNEIRCFCMDMDQDLLYEEMIGYLTSKNSKNPNDKSRRKVYVYESEGNVPHCHVVGLGSDGKKEVCVRLDKPEYFCHGVKQDKFTSDERKLFVRFMNRTSANEDEIEFSNWVAAVRAWNRYYPNNQIKIELIPNYKILPTE